MGGARPALGGLGRRAGRRRVPARLAGGWLCTLVRSWLNGRHRARRNLANRRVAEAEAIGLASALPGGRSAGETRPFRLAPYPRLFGGVAHCAVALTGRWASRYIAGVLIVAARGCQRCPRWTDRWESAAGKVNPKQDT